MGWVSPIKDEETLNKFKNALRNVDTKYYIMFEIGIGSGMLLQDILLLKVGDVYKKQKITTLIGVRQIEVSYNIPKDLQKTIVDYVGDRSMDSYLIPGHNNSNHPLSREQAYRVFKSVGKTVGLTSIGAQTMRKTFAWRYYSETGDIEYLQHLFNHASSSITYRYIGERPNVQVILKKTSAEENERSRYLLYLNDTGRKRLTNAINELTSIRDKFDDPCNNDAFYGCVDCFLQELDELIDNYKKTQESTN